MQLSDILIGLGEERFNELLRTISIGKLKTYQLYERLKARARLQKLNSESLRRSGRRLWERLAERDDEFAQDLSQAILVSHLEMIRAVLDELGVPNEDGFFAKELDPAPYLTEGWRERVWERFQDRFPRPALLFYINHLGWELKKEQSIFTPPAG